MQIRLNIFANIDVFLYAFCLILKIAWYVEKSVNKRNEGRNTWKNGILQMEKSRALSFNTEFLIIVISKFSNFEFEDQPIFEWLSFE